MLIALRKYVLANPRVSVAELSWEFKLPSDIINDMLAYLAARGDQLLKLQSVPGACGSRCGSCSEGSCVKS